VGSEASDSGTSERGDANSLDGAVPDGAAAPIRFVQNQALRFINAATGTLSYPAPVQAGNALVAIVFDTYGNPNVTSISDSLGNSFTVVLQLLNATIALAQDARGGSGSVTVNLAGAFDFDFHVLEYAGIAARSALEVAAGSAGSSTAPDGMSSGVRATSAAKGLIIGYGACTNTCYVGTGFTARSTFHGNLVEDRIFAAPGSYEAIASASYDTTEWRMFMLVLKGQ
jgi:hypothetical protein